MFTPESTEPILDDVVARLRHARGIDFGGYRRSTLLRRLSLRMMRAGARSPLAYLTTLREEPTEVDRLLEELTVKVSRFYRNALVFDTLRALLAALPRRAGEPPRLWSAGCGRGEEAYTLAMLTGDDPCAVWASDVDPAALAVARAGIYERTAAAELPDSLARRWLVSHPPASVRVGDELRRRVRLLQHDVTAHAAPPAASYDLVACRNVLIYLTPPVQRRVLERLADCLAPGGLLCLGEAEWVPDRVPTLTPVDRRLRIFRRAGP